MAPVISHIQRSRQMPHLHLLQHGAQCVVAVGIGRLRVGQRRAQAAYGQIALLRQKHAVLRHYHTASSQRPNTCQRPQQGRFATARFALQQHRVAWLHIQLLRLHLQFTVGQIALQTMQFKPVACFAVLQASSKRARRFFCPLCLTCLALLHLRSRAIHALPKAGQALGRCAPTAQIGVAVYKPAQ